MNQQPLPILSNIDAATPAVSADRTAPSGRPARKHGGLFGEFWELKILLWGMALEALAAVMTFAWYTLP